MEGNREETPANTGQQGGIIAFEPSDGQEDSCRHSISTTASNSTPEWPKKPTGSNKRPLTLSGGF